MAVARKSQQLLSASPITNRLLDPLLLRTFLVVAQGHSFTETSRKLAMRQSTVSDHIRRLEQHLARQLFLRDTHSIVLTKEGEALVGYATLILETCERADRYFAGTQLRGRLRFGATEDLVAAFLPDILETFTRQHPTIDLELTVALSSTLISRFDEGELDLVFCKRWPGEERGELVWRDEIVWFGQPALAGQDGLAADRALPLIVYPPPSITRAMAMSALTQAGLSWRLACTSDTLTGVLAAVQARLGVAAMARRLVPADLAGTTAAPALPTLGALDFVLLRNPRGPRPPIGEMAAAIMAKGRRGEGQ